MIANRGPTEGFKIVARALLDIFGYIARLSQLGEGGAVFYLFRLFLSAVAAPIEENGVGYKHPGICTCVTVEVLFTLCPFNLIDSLVT